MIYQLLESICKFSMVFGSVDFPGGSDGKASVYHVGDPGSSPGLGRTLGEGNGNPLQYSYLVNPMNKGAWRAIVHRVAEESDTT